MTNKASKSLKLSLCRPENLAIIEHTDVDESLKGQGIGKQLVAKVVEKMRREKRKIIPLCPFAKHEFDKTREYDDIRS